MTAEWIGRHQERVWRYLLCLGAAADVAEDLTQESFLAALDAPSVARDDAAWAGWLLGTARNLYYAHTRLVARRSERALPERDPAIAERAWRWLAGEHGGNGSDTLEALDQCLTLLDGRERTALELRYRDGASRRDIAERLGIGEDGAKALLRRTRTRLRDCIERRRGR